MVVHFSILPADILLTLTNSNKISPGVAGTGARFLRLCHPRTSIPSLFLLQDTLDEAMSGEPLQRIFEVQQTSPPEERSWFMNEEISADGKLLLVTPIDPVFLLLPILKAVQPQDGSLGNFRQANDIFEGAGEKIATTPSLSGGSNETSSEIKIDILHFSRLSCSVSALKHICDMKEITSDITVYRYSSSKLLDYLTRKVARLSSLKVLETSRTAIRRLGKDGLMEDKNESLLKLGCIRAACDLVAQYLPPDTRQKLTANYDFTKLDAYLKKLADDNLDVSKGSVTSSKQTSTNALTSDGKKRKATKAASQGIEKLKKVNVTGMAKLSSFFKKETKPMPA